MGSNFLRVVNSTSLSVLNIVQLILFQIKTNFIPIEDYWRYHFEG